MRFDAAPTFESSMNVDFFDFALLLAEGQSGDLDENWDLFVDNLSRITDEFAHARALTIPKTLVPMPETVDVV